MQANGIESLFDPTQTQSADDDLMDICSGQFAATQVDPPPAEFSQNAQRFEFSQSEFISQVPEADVEPEKTRSPLKNARKLLESTDDEADDVVKEKRKRKKMKKQKVKKLNFDDDEDESAQSDEAEAAEDDEEEALEEEEEAEDVLVDYDSEENEIEVKLSVKDRLKAAGEYLDEEAELSESEWGSADEDEKDLNKYDIELGDEEHFDQNKLREEVGRIHARKMLDDDIRNVKKIEELLFEDEENDGVGRERKFRWKNQTEGFGVENDNARGGDDLLDDEEVDDESEILWRTMRHERETFLSEQSQKMSESGATSQDASLMSHSSMSLTSSSTSIIAKRKFRIVKANTPMVVKSPPKGSRFLIQQGNLKIFKKASFLARDEETLNRIARFASQKDDEVSNVSSHGGNSMSFKSIDKPDDSKKRKSDGSSKQAMDKKRKLEEKKKPFLFDHL